MASGAGNFIGSIIGGAVTGGIGPAISAAMPSIADTAKILVDRLVPDPNAKAEAQAQVEQALAAREVAVINATMEVAKAQTQVNLAEATGNDRFSARWRPSVGWICAAGFGYQFVLAPILTWATNLAGVMIGAAIPPAPVLKVEDLMVVLTGILGLGIQRTVERVQGVPGALPGVAQPAK
ncbi:3TM-type holin [Methylobacterium sp. 092160098-2]|uniref:3TM-type holin n=1 Tax=Methylobacterium sp. 092160098-2 TaxID=3025129 RepID=UPI0023819BF6|nr:3TM-type holin [Methylobacterium sp. 092160098-2]MDE4913460.1 3TM-type holin [Methylobacterium sp. 092160098-2]